MAKTNDLFKSRLNQEEEDGVAKAASHRPLADLLRPAHLSEVMGQDHLIGENGVLTRMLAGGVLNSMIFWGPPGSGKTTLARLVAQETPYAFEQISAIFSGVSDLKRVFEAAAIRRSNGQQTLLFVDEIHRFNRAQLDSFLPVLEDGTIILIGATTENPSFALNGALLSRAKVLVFHPHDEESLSLLLARAEQLKGRPLPLDDDARLSMLRMADGDGRAILNLAEEVWQIECDEPLDREGLQALLQARVPLYDKGQDGHYNLISALHKSIRGSDADAALYYFCRMMDGGEDPLYIGRRLVRMALEDIGLADPQAVIIANGAKEAYAYLGSPEGDLALAQACVYLAMAPKSNAIYKAYGKAMKDAREFGSLVPPKHILNAPTKLMKDEGYNAGYIYDHDAPDGYSGQVFFPQKLGERRYYEPEERGFEREIIKRQAWWAKLREQRRKK